MYRPAKVGNLQIALQIDQEVLWLDVPVDDLFRVAIVEGIC